MCLYFSQDAKKESNRSPFDNRICRNPYDFGSDFAS
ncbi:hypothetical protein D046_2906A, partial [Vibrio parahaemolyticus V-223/04]